MDKNKLTGQIEVLKDAITKKDIKKRDLNPEKPIQTINNLNYCLEISKDGIQKSIPKNMDINKFTQIVLNSVRSNPNLLNCTAISLICAVLTSAQLGLEPNTPLGEAYLIPYSGKAQFQIGYKGLIKLCYQSGEFEYITANSVYEKDKFDYEYGTNQFLKHKPALLEDRGEIKFHYAIYLKKGYSFQHFFVASHKELIEFGKTYSKASTSLSPWKTATKIMCQKTCIKQLLKYAPIDPNFNIKLAQDTTIKSVISPNMEYVKNEMDYELETEEQTEETEAIETKEEF